MLKLPSDIRPITQTGRVEPAIISVPGAGNAGQKSLLPVAAAARSVVFVLDRSASMGIDDRLGVAREQILATLGQLPPTARFQVIVYNRQCAMLLQGPSDWVPVSPQTRAEAAADLRELSPEGGNDHLRALEAALYLQPEAIILITDADDLTIELVQQITRKNRGQCAINAVTIGSAPRQAMKALAEWNRGTCQGLDAKR